MINIKDKSACCGCSACEQVCPKNAIIMIPDSLGFLYPQVNMDRCVDCGLCEKVCSFNANYEKNNDFELPIAYAVRHKNIEEVERSRSGAMFVAMSDWVLERGGVVYGAGYEDHFRVVHKRAVTKSQRDEFRGSKYVQSDLNNVFFQIYEDLKEDKLVLFSGTPCQTSGLRSYLLCKRIDISKLYIVDLICHGVPSPYYWRDYLGYLERKEGKKIKDLSFRDKKLYGWGAHKESFIFDDGECKSYPYKYYNSLIFRKSCSICYFANIKRPSDITIGDFWGWEKVCEHMNEDDKGINLVFLNSIKGKMLYENIKNNIDGINVEIEKSIQPNLMNPTKRNRKRDCFENDYEKHGFLYVFKKYADFGYWHKVHSILSWLKKKH